jgi:1,4-alpha-glucan branching enzyme
MRKILFTYRNPHAKAVSIRADFTGWKAEPMKKAAGGSWTYRAQLTPGEYAYCYTADDKTFKDPANKRTKQIGRTTVSAILVEALPAKAAH